MKSLYNLRNQEKKSWKITVVMFCKVVLFVSFLHWVGNELHLNGLVENSWSKYETSKYYNTIHSNNTLCCNKSFVQCSILLLDVKRQLVKYICKKLCMNAFKLKLFKKKKIGQKLLTAYVQSKLFWKNQIGQQN